MAGPSFDPATGLNVPVELPTGLAARLAQPICADILVAQARLGQAEPALRRPDRGGGRRRDAVPDSCALNFSLLHAARPILAPMKCFLAVLNLVAPLIDIVKGLPFPPAKAIADFAEAVPPVLECIRPDHRPGLPLFLKDVICLIVEPAQLPDRPVALDPGTDQRAVDPDRRRRGQSAASGHPGMRPGNAENAAGAAMQSFEPVVAILELITPILDSVTGQSIEIPRTRPGRRHRGDGRPDRDARGVFGRAQPDRRRPGGCD